MVESTALLTFVPFSSFLPAQFAIPRILGFDEMFAGAPEIRESMPSAPAPQGEPPF
jgi:hypothetical protein